MSLKQCEGRWDTWSWHVPHLYMADLFDRWLPFISHIQPCVLPCILLQPWFVTKNIVGPLLICLLLFFACLLLFYFFFSIYLNVTFLNGTFQEEKTKMKILSILLTSKSLRYSYHLQENQSFFCYLAQFTIVTTKIME